MKVYLDYGATTPVDKRVIDEMLPYFDKKYGNASSLHQFGQVAKEALETARETIARSINAENNEIVFTSGGTESDNIALQQICFSNKKKGDHIITSKIEHPAILNTCKFLESHGFKITYLNVNKKGIINLDELEKAITKSTIIVSIIAANNEIGSVQPIKEIGAICKKNNIYFHTDAVQAYCKMPIDVKSMNIDMLSTSAHKIHGPKGIGFLYVKSGTCLNSLIHGGSHEHGLRAGTENVAGIVGFAKATELFNKEELEKTNRLRERLTDSILKNIDNCTLNGPKKDRLVNNVNISFEFIEGESLLLYLDMKGIAVSTGSACSSRSLKPSHVLEAIGLKPEDSHGAIRFTLGRFNTEEEIDYTIECLKEIVKELRELSPLKG